MTTIPEILVERLSWANNRIENFERRFNLFVNTITHEMVSEKDIDGIKQIFRYRLKISEELPIELGFLAGDCIHNLRSVLDNVIWHLGKKNGIANRYLSEFLFPVCISPDSFEISVKKINRLSQPIIETVRSLQPYNEYQGRNDPDLHPLRILHRFWSDDKHRTPILILGFHTGTGVTPILGEPKPLPNGRVMLYESSWDNLTMNVGGSIYDGKEFATVIQDIGKPEPQLFTRLSFKVSFDMGGKPEKQPASQHLRDLHKFISEEVIPKFEPFFK